MDNWQNIFSNRIGVHKVIVVTYRLFETNQALLSSFDFDAAGIFRMISSNGEFVTGEDIQAFMSENNR